MSLFLDRYILLYEYTTERISGSFGAHGSLGKQSCHSQAGRHTHWYNLGSLLRLEVVFLASFGAIIRRNKLGEVNVFLTFGPDGLVVSLLVDLGIAKAQRLLV